LFVPVISIDLLGNLSCVVTQRVTSIFYWDYLRFIKLSWSTASSYA